MNPLSTNEVYKKYNYYKKHFQEVPRATLKETISQAFEIPFDQLPLYINHSSEVIRCIAKERLHRK